MWYQSKLKRQDKTEVFSSPTAKQQKMSGAASEADYARLKDTLHNTARSVPLANRFRALFSLRGLATPQAIDIIGQGEFIYALAVQACQLNVFCIALPLSSALLGHELAYCLGQIGKVEALPVLESVLRNEQYHSMVRHEAAEAMAAISSLKSLPILREYRDRIGECKAVTETCEIAVAKIEWDHRADGLDEKTQRRCVSEPFPMTSINQELTAFVQYIRLYRPSTSTLDAQHTTRLHVFHPSTPISTPRYLFFPFPTLQSNVCSPQRCIQRCSPRTRRWLL